MTFEHNNVDRCRPAKFRNRIVKILPCRFSPFPQNTKLLTKFPGLVTSGRYYSAMITDLKKFTTKLPFIRNVYFLFLPLKSIQSLFPWLYAAYKERNSHIFGNIRCSCSWVNHICRCSCLSSDMEEKQTELKTEHM